MVNLVNKSLILTSFFAFQSTYRGIELFIIVFPIFFILLLEP